ncbi:MAG: hypothetical protein QM800_04980 [Paludibacter sp.]
MQIHVQSISAQTPSIVLKLDNATIEQAFNAIESQTSYNFLYNKLDVDTSRKISIQSFFFNNQ